MHSTDWTGVAYGFGSKPRDVSLSIHYNGDYSGDVVIDLPESLVKLKPVGYDDYKYCEVRIPFAALRTLVASYVREQTIEALEPASDEDVLFAEWTVTGGE